MAASLPNNDDKKWPIFEDDMPIDDFLKRNPPSQIEGSQYSYLCVRHSDFSKIKSPDKASLRKECDCHIENFGEITSDYILQLAEKYDYKTRKWLIHPERQGKNRHDFSSCKSKEKICKLANNA